MASCATPREPKNWDFFFKCECKIVRSRSGLQPKTTLPPPDAAGHECTSLKCYILPASDPDFNRLVQTLTDASLHEIHYLLWCIRCACVVVVVGGVRVAWLRGGVVQTPAETWCDHEILQGITSPRCRRFDLLRIRRLCPPRRGTVAHIPAPHSVTVRPRCRAPGKCDVPPPGASSSSKNG